MGTSCFNFFLGGCFLVLIILSVAAVNWWHESCKGNLEFMGFPVVSLFFSFIRGRWFHCALRHGARIPPHERGFGARPGQRYPGLIDPKRLLNWRGSIEVSDYDYLGRTLLINHGPWFIIPVLTLTVSLWSFSNNHWCLIVRHLLCALYVGFWNLTWLWTTTSLKWTMFDSSCYIAITLPNN